MIDHNVKQIAIDRDGLWGTRLGIGLLAVWLSASTFEPSFSQEAISSSLSERFANVALEGPYPETPNFQRHVVSLLGRLGCNGRSCHGSFQGRGGFRLSMFGYDFDDDHKSLLAGEPMRVNIERPIDSLILRKPTSDKDHEGGKRFEPDGWEAKVLRAWIAKGAVNDSSSAGKLERIEVTPTELLFQKADQQIPLRVVAHWSDSTREDVTCLSHFASNMDSTAAVDEFGRVTAQSSGDTHIVVSYDNAVVSVPAMFAFSRDDSGQPSTEDKPTDERRNKIDQLIIDKLRKLGQSPSDDCNDEEFLRRLSLDMTGTLPTPQEVLAFVEDTDTDKRSKKTDQLLESPAYALWWATLFADITGLNGPQQLGSTDFGPIIAEQWRSWMERKIRDNVPYDKIVEGMIVAVSRQPSQSYEDYTLKMSSYTRKHDPVDFAERPSMPHFWFRGNLVTNDDKALAFSYAFMGVRLDCAMSQASFRSLVATRFQTVRGHFRSHSLGR